MLLGASGTLTTACLQLWFSCNARRTSPTVPFSCFTQLWSMWTLQEFIGSVSSGGNWILIGTKCKHSCTVPWVHIKKRRLLKIIVESVTVASLIEPVISLSQTVHNYDTFLNKIIMFCGTHSHKCLSSEAGIWCFDGCHGNSNIAL